jgi:predicted Rossmann fold flavoprotein
VPQTKGRAALVAATEVAVVGGGPAGLIAGCEAASAGAAVLLLEAGESPGRKLLLTGKKRCNLTSTLPLEEFLQAYGPGGRFLRNAYSRFFSDDLTLFLKSIGVETARERGGRIYPSRGGAAGVLRALRRALISAGAELRTDSRVTRLSLSATGGFRLGGERFSLSTRKVVLATGGASFPQTGSRGDGFRLARRLGHRIVEPRPALVPVRCTEKFLPRLAGLRLRNVSLTLRPPGKKRIVFSGEVHFTDFGVSGPAVFPASKIINRLTEQYSLPLTIDLKPSLTSKTLEARLLRELTAGGRRTLAGVMATLLPRQLLPVFIEAAGASPETRAGEVGRDLRRRILVLLQAFPLTASGTLPLEKGMVTAGGVDLKDVHPATMESRLVPGLYFGGEILDVDGPTGGFNLQAAFSTGFLAGRNAAVSLEERG